MEATKVGSCVQWSYKALSHEDSSDLHTIMLTNFICTQQLSNSFILKKIVYLTILWYINGN